jgi:hypothetical protein
MARTTTYFCITPGKTFQAFTFFEKQVICSQHLTAAGRALARHCYQVARDWPIPGRRIPQLLMVLPALVVCGSGPFPRREGVLWMAQVCSRRFQRSGSQRWGIMYTGFKLRSAGQTRFLAMLVRLIDISRAR